MSSSSATTETSTQAKEKQQQKGRISTINPATEEIINQYEIMVKEQINERLEKAQKTFEEWKKNLNKRIDCLHDLATELRKNKENLARAATKEMGKAIKESRSEIEKCAWVVEYYADNGPTFMKEDVINTDARKSLVAFQPIGVIGSIMPWNFPYWQALRFASPSLILGNTVVLKPASATMQCGIEIENSFNKIGAPEGVFQTLIGDSSIAETLIDSDNISAITFTGSVSVGGKVAQRATSQIKKCVLELGGSDPFIVCEDADIDKASSGAVKGRFINCGQSCIASKRFIILKKVANEFIEKFVQKAERLRVGDPLSDDTDMGPLVNNTGLENIEDIVEESVKNGAHILTGGERLGKRGYFYKPTIIKDVSRAMRIAQEEVFGPVAPIITVDSEDEAITLANDTEYGLGASIWTQDLDRAERLSNEIQSGLVTVNNIVASDPRVPFGGVKKSGFGRELSTYGMIEFANIKSVRFYDELVDHHHVE
ncbi:MAG TPA: NAD-dependent succinate-semialdehyde dehydrogenase [Nitrososphaeraceae archaeon]|nr:NAD-dependent succinate-semialdehyde dehydrogenase [Nitrososphaeraceae archaeon]